MNKLLKFIGIIIIILFLSLYFSKYSNSYYEEKTLLTEESIKQYEKDLKTGKNIVSNNYIPKEKDYNNKASKLGIKASKLIEDLVNNTLKYIVKYMDNSS